MKASIRPLGHGLRLMVAGLVVFCGSAAVAEKLESLPKPTDYVSDYAHVLSPEAISQIDRISSEIEHSAANAQIAVVTIHSLDGEDRDDYANRLYHQMGIGAKGKDRGILIFLSVNDHQRRIEVGFGLEGILPDAKVGDIGRSAVPYLKANDFDSGILTQVSQVAQVIATDANVTLSDEAPVTRSAPRRAHRGSPFGGFILLIILLVLFGGSWIFRLLFGGLLLNSLGGGWRGGGWGGGGWGSGGGWGGGGGGFGGGDSGGGGGFGGFGGGDSGGGGAGGSW
jgi:uncharacterized protein